MLGKFKNKYRVVVGSYLKITRPYVYVVLECSELNYSKELKSEKVHGVYINKEEAEGKRLKLQKQTNKYIAVLKKPLQGKSLL